MNEYLASGQFPLHLVVFFSGLFSCVMLWLIKDPKIPPWVDFLTAVSLLLFSAVFLGIVSDLKDFLPENSDAKSLKTQYSVALAIVPFFTAALASNILSNLVLSRRDYVGTYSFSEFLKTVLTEILRSISILLVLPYVTYLAYRYTKKMTTAKKPD